MVTGCVEGRVGKWKEIFEKIGQIVIFPCLCVCAFVFSVHSLASVTNFYLEKFVLSDQKMFFWPLYQHCGSLFVLHKHLHLNHPWETADVLLCLSYCKARSKANGSARIDQKIHHHNWLLQHDTQKVYKNAKHEKRSRNWPVPGRRRELAICGISTRPPVLTWLHTACNHSLQPQVQSTMV